MIFLGDVSQIDTDGTQRVSKITSGRTFPDDVPLLHDTVVWSPVVKENEDSPSDCQDVEKNNPLENFVLSQIEPLFEFCKLLTA